MIKTEATKLFFFCTLAAFCLFANLPVQAQLKGVPLHTPAPAKEKAGGNNLRKAAAPDTLTILPFWDDFSYLGGAPDTTLWENSEVVSITRSIAIRPPSIGVATFDGLDANGQPHSQNPDMIGRMDILTSKPIQLGLDAVSVAEQDSLFLSFYWQVQGRGEGPEMGDSLRLYFLDSDSIAYQVWPSSLNSVPPEASPAEFNWVTINLKEASERFNTNFFHDGFRFQFASTNRLSGSYDLWHLDYVHLGKGDSNNKFYAEDRALSTIQPSLFKTYTALPVDQFFAAPDKYIDSLYSITAFNLGDSTKRTLLEYYIDIYANGQLVFDKDTIDFTMEELGQIYYDHTTTLGDFPSILKSLAGEDSLYLKTVVRIEEEENIFREPWYARNDTASIINVLHDYFAYDDGSAEGGMALRGGSGVRLAYEYTLEERDTLTHLDMYLPYYSQSIGGQFASLTVWKSLAMEEGGGTDSVLATMSIPLNNSSARDQFDSYKFPRPVILPAGTYYFGIEKETTRDITIGFDRNTNSRDKVFISTDMESWSAALEEEGSLMLRPRFAEYVAPPPVGITQPQLSFPVRVYPNPNNGFFVVESEAHSIQVFNIQGQLLLSLEQAVGINSQEVDLRGVQPGLYLIKLRYRDGIITKKILIKK